MSTSPAIPGAQQPSNPSLAQLTSEFITRRRVPLSIFLFGGMLAIESFRGTHPRNLLDVGDPIAMGAGILIFTGTALRSWAAGILHKGTEVTTSGPYRMIRNPLYAGSFLMMIGFGALLATPISLLIVMVPVVAIYTATVRSEERQLARKFPAQWNEYSASTPRFIPCSTRVDLRAPFDIRQWLRHREYRAIAGALLALAGITIWHLAKSN